MIIFTMMTTGRGSTDQSNRSITVVVIAIITICTLCNVTALLSHLIWSLHLCFTQLKHLEYYR